MHQHPGQEHNSRSDVWRALCRATRHPVSPGTLDALRDDARALLRLEVNTARAVLSDHLPAARPRQVRP